MLKIGLTGGIGSGKTTVAKIFELLGINVYYADIRAKKLLNSFELRPKITKIFGDIYKNGLLDKKKLAEIVFNDKNKLQQLNKIVHPAVERDFELWCKNKIANHYIIKEAAILFESGSHKYLDKIIMVFAPEDVRINRVCKRDNTTREKVIARIKNQWSDEEKIKLSDFVIKNYGNNLVIPQVLAIDKALRSL